MSPGTTPERPPAARRRSLFDPIGRLVDSVVPTMTDAIDVDDIVTRIDVNALVSRVDVEELLGRIDVDELLGRIDVDHLLLRIDVDQLLGRIDVNALLDRIDVPTMMARVDVDAILERVDVDRLIKRADLAGIIAQSTHGITANMVDLVRRQVAGIDAITTRVAARVIRRDPKKDPIAPLSLQGIPSPARPGDDRLSITGHYAGPVARASALGLDWLLVVFLFGIGTAGGRWIINLLAHRERGDPILGSSWVALLFGIWTFAYFGVSLWLTGRTVGKAIVGLRVVRRDGEPLQPLQAFARVLLLPLSFALMGLGLIGAAFGRERRTLHDVIVGSVEVIDWGDRPAALPSPLSNWLVSRQDAALT